MPILAIVFKYLTPALTLFLKALDKTVDDPNVRQLIRSIGRKCWDSFTTDPVFNAKAETIDKTLADPNLTVEERQSALKDLSSSHPKP